MSLILLVLLLFATPAAANPNWTWEQWEPRCVERVLCIPGTGDRGSSDNGDCTDGTATTIGTDVIIGRRVGPWFSVSVTPSTVSTFCSVDLFETFGGYHMNARTKIGRVRCRDGKGTAPGADHEPNMPALRTVHFEGVAETLIGTLIYRNVGTVEVRVKSCR